MTSAQLPFSSWRPLSGEIRERVVKVLDSIGERYRNPEEVCLRSKSIPTLEVDGFEIERWNDGILSNGYPGICLLLAQLDLLYPEDGWDQTGHMYLEKLQKLMEEMGMYDLSLYSGLAGVLIGIRALSRGGTRYQSMLNQVASWFEELAAERIPLYMEQWHSGHLKMSDYDTIMGFTGIGRIILFFYERPKMKELWGQIVGCFQLFCGDKNWEGQRIPFWHICAEHQFLQDEKRQYPKGNFNLSLSHGIAGPLALMSISVLQGVTSKEVNKEIPTLAEWLTKWQIESQVGTIWPGKVSFEEWEQSELSVGNTQYQRDSWCYGAPGIARSIWLAGKALQNDEWISLGLKAYLDIENRIDQNGGMASATVCHGLGGLLHLLQRMYSDTGNERLGALRDLLVERVLDMFDPNSIFGYYDVNFLNGDYKNIDEAGFLTGTAGIALVLASLISDRSPEWDAVLMIR
ncbi:lanthionine synthetase C family protein [Paenibacillus sp. EKM202P]|uniref:lanthionine synthetase C family protein n=1 Tax=unclassified Paenibacillus TaxID=185978 RepID=UPI0013ED39BC|nr:MULTISPECIES: lanthionine synthetase C family protein [unclassified Paenibacillus]KAF6562906.1 lanthionine synthetase C family protein [Paenibacillus sp. EKM207P]KAF6563786.1 lanthionine synthetase C family protein [Paenibacillus sp. EKM202P]